MIWNSNIDSEHCMALKHEFLRCEDAFKEFEQYANIMILQGESRFISYKTYNAYSDFLHHLYEFLKGATLREVKLNMVKGGVANKIKCGSDIKDRVADECINNEVQIVLNGRRNAILKGYAPEWENHISYYPEKVPEDFSEEFRHIRNHITGHVSHKRPTISLSEFYNKYHKFVHMMYVNCLGHWGQEKTGIPDMKEITDFSVLIKNDCTINKRTNAAITI